MLFPTPTFAIFFAIVLPVSWLLMRRPRAWRIAIVVASYVFYAVWDWRFVFVLAGSTLGNQGAAILLDRLRPGPARRAALTAAVAANLVVLGYFKYAGFFLLNAHNAGAWLGLDVPVPMASVILPVGISFYTFHAIAYLVDTYRGTSRPTSLAKLAVYLSFFPHLVAGPISRPREFVSQLATPRDAHAIDASLAYLLIVSGLVKKLVIATELARIVDPVFGAPGAHSSLELLLGVYAYAFQIWADFSGYTDIAIGVALLLGLRLPQNFDAPYAAVSVTDFWSRWHITLSRWLRDYLFFPMSRRFAVGAASRATTRTRLGTYGCLFLTMVIAGLWHGAGWTFVVWGAIHGTALACERAYRDLRRLRGLPAPAPSRARRAAHRLLTFNVVCLAWVFFRADSLANAFAVLEGIVTQWGGGVPLLTTGVVVAALAGLAWNYLPSRVGTVVADRFSRLPAVAQGATLAAAVTVVFAMGPAGVAPFIYFRF